MVIAELLTDEKIENGKYYTINDINGIKYVCSQSELIYLIKNYDLNLINYKLGKSYLCKRKVKEIYDILDKLNQQKQRFDSYQNSLLTIKSKYHTNAIVDSKKYDYFNTNNILNNKVQTVDNIGEYIKRFNAKAKLLGLNSSGAYLISKLGEDVSYYTGMSGCPVILLKLNSSKFIVVSSASEILVDQYKKDDNTMYTLKEYELESNINSILKEINSKREDLNFGAVSDFSWNNYECEANYTFYRYKIRYKIYGDEHMIIKSYHNGDDKTISDKQMKIIEHYFEPVKDHIRLKPVKNNKDQQGFMLEII